MKEKDRGRGKRRISASVDVTVWDVVSGQFDSVSDPWKATEKVT